MSLQIGHRIRVTIEPPSDRCGATRKPWGFYSEKGRGNIGYIVQLNLDYENIKPGDKVWAKITRKNSREPVFYATVISVNGIPYSNEIQQ